MSSDKMSEGKWVVLAYLSEQLAELSGGLHERYAFPS